MEYSNVINLTEGKPVCPIRLINIPTNEKRLNSAIRAIAEQEYTLSVSNCTIHEMTATISKEEKAYNVKINRFGAECDCPDWTYRKTICKHILILAIVFSND